MSLAGITVKSNRFSSPLPFLLLSKKGQVCLMQSSLEAALAPSWYYSLRTQLAGGEIMLPDICKRKRKVPKPVVPFPFLPPAQQQQAQTFHWLPQASAAPPCVCDFY